ncbi:MAG: hypothetical protein AB4372_12080 [Xenococcus sp. (in: cyanobacteria)]
MTTTQILTPDYIRSLQSNKHISTGFEVPCADPIEANSNDWDQHYFQILIIEKDNNAFLEPKLVYGTKEKLQNKYKLNPLPTTGAKVDGEFLEDLEGTDITKNSLKYSIGSTVRFLLQCRILSKLVASTWLEKDQVDQQTFQKIELSRKILDSYNIEPKSYRIDGNSLVPMNDIELEDFLKYIKNLPSTDKIKNKVLSNKDSFLIKPRYVSYNSVSLALLLCGHAYFQCREGSNYDEDSQILLEKIWEPVFSTYEMVWEYGIDVSWDTFYASRTDIPQTGKDPKPPYTKVTIGYPPRPNEYNLTQEQIREWCQAGEDFEGSKYPFYPRKYTSYETETSEKWQNKELEFVVPPHPYIPLSTI